MTARPGPAGTVFHHGRIHTLDPAQPEAEALAVEGGRVVAVGSSREVLDAFPRHRRIDLEGLAAVPAFTDSHIHLVSYGLSLRRLWLDGVPTLARAVAAVAGAVRAAPPGEWVLGRGWNKNPWPEDRFPRASDLDPVSPRTPVALRSKDGHLLWANSEALRRAGVTRDTPDPRGGEIARDERGEPTGVLKEQAVALVSSVIPAPGDAALDAATDAAMAEMHRLGITAVHVVEGADALRAFQRRLRRGGRPVRVTFYLPVSGLDAAAALGIQTGLGDDRLRIGGIKAFTDGALGGQTAWMLEPYEGLPHAGIAIYPPDDLRALVRRAIEAGLACAIHAIGDRANREVLDAFEAALPDSRARGLRHRIEHVQLLHPDDLPRLSRLGVVASMQPIHATSDRDTADRYWGARARFGYAWRSLLASGAAVAFGSDAPVETPDVFQGIYAAVARRRPDDPRPAWYPEERLTVEQALRAYTLGAAHAVGDEGTRGTLTAGKAADLVVLSDDPLAVEPEALPAVRVVTTVADGEVVYSVLSSGSSSNPSGNS